jgi:hypothetical protein
MRLSIPQATTVAQSQNIDAAGEVQQAILSSQH